MLSLICLLLLQGPAPETASTMFPGGGYISYNSVLDARQSRPHEGTVDVATGLKRDWQLEFELPLTTVDSAGTQDTGVGEALLALKYRFLRLDSSRGTTQGSVSVGPRFGSSVTHEATDLYLNGSFTYTGLFNLEKLVADITTDDFIRAHEFSSRLWVPYRPYQSTTVGPEWWVGPSLRVERNVFSNGSVVMAGAATYVSPAAGTTLWAGIEFPRDDRRWSFGITRQFRLPGKWVHL